jgi:hypothetical protein
MIADVILAVIAGLFLVAAAWETVRHGGRLSPSARTWLLVAGIFLAVATFLRLVRG